MKSDGGTRTTVPAMPTKPAGADRAVSEDGRRIRTFPCVFPSKTQETSHEGYGPLCQLCQTLPKPFPGWRSQAGCCTWMAPDFFSRLAQILAHMRECWCFTLKRGRKLWLAGARLSLRIGTLFNRLGFRVFQSKMQATRHKE